jgi:hypothetical protein
MTDEEKSTTFIARLSGGPFKEATFQFDQADKDELQKILAKLLNKVKPQPAMANVAAFIQTVELEIGKFIVLKALDRDQPQYPNFDTSLDELVRTTRRLKQAWRAVLSPNLPLWICLGSTLEPDPALAKNVDSQGHGMSWQEFTTGVKGPHDDEGWAQLQSSAVRQETAARLLQRLDKDITTLCNAISQSYKALQEDKEMAHKSGRAPRSKGGRPKNHWRRILALNIARAFLDHLGTPPTASKEGPFESVLRVALRSAEEDVQDLHRLVLETIKQLRVQKPSSPQEETAPD